MQWSTALRVGKAIVDNVSRADLGLAAAGVAFFGMFAIFPALAAVIAIFGILADPGIVEDQFELWRQFIPEDVFRILYLQVSRLLDTQSDTLGWTTIIAVLLALWTSRASVSALIRGLNAIHGAPERTGLAHMIRVMVLTGTLILLAIVALLVVVIAPIVLAIVPLPQVTQLIAEGLRWVAGVAIVFFGLGALYRWGPNVPGDRASLANPGTFFAVLCGILASTGLSLYLSNFGNYNELYGSIGAVMALMIWLYIMALLALVGAAVNVALRAERRRRRELKAARIADRQAEKEASRARKEAEKHKGDGDPAMSGDEMTMPSEDDVSVAEFRAEMEGKQKAKAFKEAAEEEERPGHMPLPGG
ncbi:YihY/virulence factor BrkB family protein [Pseudoroseicyclus tamaricis]|uniref:YihY/virulence factor BrkB family protein n=1 Tax=Pseudoroseicyclus tamaricis TaxID=2705421 RepID=A0A6B2JS28_9RHOB|nr:YihY/virulence factor BrkB family protein [Pseudoroseicyclus tamaricis]NDV01018.1 YihY/virulence factor BrkB family protein [Pseudoroseicyclus tamaricis]